MEKFMKYKEEYFYKNTTYVEYKNIEIENFAEEILKELGNKGISDFESEIFQLEEEQADIKKQKSEVLKKIKLNKEDEKLLKYAEKTISWVDIRKTWMMEQFYFLFSLITDIGKSLNISSEDLLYLTMDELRGVIVNKANLDKEEIMRRRKGAFFVYEKDAPLKVFYEKDFKKMLDAANNIPVSQEKELNGTVASKGKGNLIISGIARIVKDPLKDKFEQGEILIASMTRIEFVPLMKKASAIITNEGGIACHAAIIARELGIPCIISVKNATYFIHNGDEIEVDLNNGIIKVL